MPQITCFHIILQFPSLLFYQFSGTYVNLYLYLYLFPGPDKIFGCLQANLLDRVSAYKFLFPFIFSLFFFPLFFLFFSFFPLFFPFPLFSFLSLPFPFPFCAYKLGSLPTSNAYLLTHFVSPCIITKILPKYTKCIEF